ncbi:DUF4365 domain-containing protein [Vibrio diabolicus]|uniref:DUF4365 domain-containing protein n=1 Tax=Vibrio diabolicus TaxID=50719 RepID=UPI0021601F86|nr:DUF4365 domain-containing protein [Vibrio diabolicus]MCS0401997.1 DUF4365 domain-containing protein [Vibrio diabolicus]
MVFDKEFPKRHTNHILETMSYKIFNNAIPNTWMVRELTERDYGFDALVELTTLNNEVNGKIAAIQLKASSQFTFNQAGVYKHYAIDKRTTNLWLSSNVLTFLFFTDEATEILYFIPIQTYVRDNFSRYKSSEKFFYEVSSFDIFTPDKFVNAFVACEKLPELESQITGIKMLYENFSKFFDENHGRDFHMPIDDESRERGLYDLYNKIEHVCTLLDICWDVAPIDTYISQNTIGSYVEMYEYHMTEILKLIDVKLLKCLEKVKEITLVKHSDYWLAKDANIVDFCVGLKIESQYQKYRNWVNSSRNRV